mgnify:CR=1 FL=1
MLFGFDLHQHNADRIQRNQFASLRKPFVRTSFVPHFALRRMRSNSPHFTSNAFTRARMPSAHARRAANAALCRAPRRRVAVRTGAVRRRFRGHSRAHITSHHISRHHSRQPSLVCQRATARTSGRQKTKLAANAARLIALRAPG